VKGNAPKGVAFHEQHGAESRLANSDRIGEHGLKDRLKLAG
jgi:hypothetical protein